MPTKRPVAEVDIDLHPQAAERARQYINEFAVTLIMHAKTLAYSKRSDSVMPNHIDSAFALVKGKGQRSWLRQITIILGSAAFGIFVQGFVNELSAGDKLQLAAYTGLGFLGLFIVLWGLRR